MERVPAPTALFAGDPVWLEESPASVGALFTALGLAAPASAGQLPLAPGVVLVHGLAYEKAAPLTLRWVRLLHATGVGTGAAPAEIRVVLTGSFADAGRALRVVGRLRAGLADPGLVKEAAETRRRDELVRALRALDLDGESPLTADEIVAVLATTASGLAAVDAARRRAVCGPNLLSATRRRSLVLRVGEQFVSLLAGLLWAGGALALIAGLPELGWAIFAVIVVNGVFSFFQEFRAERALETLQAMLPHEITVVRDGVETRIAAAELVPGDVVRLGEGDQVPADVHLVDSHNLRVDQSALTGEPHPAFKGPVPGNERARVPRLERRELAFAGCGVVSGAATGVVVATGMATEIGDIAHLTQAVVTAPSPLQREMKRVTRIVTALALAFGAGFFLLGVATGRLSLAEGVVFALGVIVANVPEGLLPTLTLALALGVQRMARRRTLVKRLSAVESLGATTVICTDKTGTLTEGQMAMRAAWVADRSVAASEIVGEDAAIRRLLEVGVLASQATAERGDPTEVAIVRAAADAGLDPAGLREARPLLTAHPFDSFRKRMTMVRGERACAIAYVKGAARETIALCDTVRRDGQPVPLDDAGRRECLAEHDRLAAHGLRLLAVAERPLAAGLVDAASGTVERGLTLIGLVALWDPPRAEVPDAIAQCRRAGIRVIVMTGDYGLTAQHIGEQIGLPVAKVVTGDEVERMRPETLRGLVREPDVLYARMSPAHKLAVVQAAKAEGEVVAVTGDGVNDAPALKAADVGVAMGGRGTEVAREAAEIVVTDDNFASIVHAIRQGRAIYSNMGKFITYIFASNVPELVPFLVFVFFGVPLPLTIMQILAVDLGTDLLPALALGAEPEEPGVMDRPPRPRDEPLLTGARLLRAYGFLGVIEAVLSLAAFFWTYWLAGWRPGMAMASSGPLYRRATTMSLAGIVAAQIGNVFACRTDRESVFKVGIASNPLVLLAIALEVAVLLGLIALPLLRSVFGLEPPTFGEWAVLLVFPPVVLAADEARKWVVRRWRRARP
jgi:Ca2+-transporting ATPase